MKFVLIIIACFVVCVVLNQACESKDGDVKTPQTQQSYPTACDISGQRWGQLEYDIKACATDACVKWYIQRAEQALAKCNEMSEATPQ